MTTKQLLDSIQNTFKEGLALCKKKNHDYAGGEDCFKNFRAAEFLGHSVEDGILFRTMDKMARISNLIKKGGKNAVKDESINDTIIDAINYLAILKSYLENEKI